eukprot:1186410-Prorocentrum_minimum.AAC.3
MLPKCPPSTPNYRIRWHGTDAALMWRGIRYGDEIVERVTSVRSVVRVKTSVRGCGADVALTWRGLGSKPGVHYEDAFIEIVPWKGPVEWEVAVWGKWRIEGSNDKYIVEVTATCEPTDGTQLRAPTADQTDLLSEVGAKALGPLPLIVVLLGDIHQGLAGFCKDTFAGKVGLRVWRRLRDGSRGALVVDASSAQRVCLPRTPSALRVRAAEAPTANANNVPAYAVLSNRHYFWESLECNAISIRPNRQASRLLASRALTSVLIVGIECAGGAGGGRGALVAALEGEGGDGGAAAVGVGGAAAGGGRPRAAALPAPPAGPLGSSE